ncbi:Holliday junction branch migration DNA helicase RuvB [Candidatus Jorgensenbacteria bacterium]|nr:Holliday junction branch migration DNA helicase RuvB [Candidatus Jorgensenbacteria bacterium]
MQEITNLNPEDQTVDLALRPKTWDEYVGQDKVKSNLRLIIDAAKQRSEACDHLLFYGQAGLGKTTLAYLIGKEMGVNIRPTTGPTLERAGDVAALLSNLEPYEILFIDEAHRLNKLVEEILYPAMETRRLHLIVGKGPSARTFSIDLPPFTIVAATTKVNLLSGPLRSRFGATFRLDYYQHSDIEKIIKRSASMLNVSISSEAVATLAKAARFTPRVANRLLKRTRDYAQVNNLKQIDETTINQTLELLDVDTLGLENADRQLLTTIIKKFNGGPVGLKALAAALNDEVGTIEDVYEPFLMKLGFIHRTPTGRIATALAYEHLNLPNRATLV